MTCLSFLLAGTLLILWGLDTLASLLNLSFLKKPFPKECADCYTPEEQKRADSYTRTKEIYHIFSSAIGLAALLCFWFLGGFSALDKMLFSLGKSEVTTGIYFIGALFLLKGLLHLPLELYSTFVIEQRFGFNKQSLKLFFMDKIKGLLLSALLGIPLLFALLWIFNNVHHAWIWAWGVFTIFQLLITYLAPSLILPLFNRFSPMEEGERKTSIENLAKQCNFPLGEISIMDGSKRSTKANAFFAGFGKLKRIALYDTLLDMLSTQELLAVLAHEIGHFKKKHIIWRLCFSLGQTSILFYFLGLFTQDSSPWSTLLFQSFGLSNYSLGAAFVFFSILLTPLTFLLSLLTHGKSRRDEYEADAYAKEALKSPHPLISALKKLSTKSLSHLNEHPLSVFLHHSHPTLIQRIRALD